MFDPKQMLIFSKPDALKGIRVISFTRIIYGPWATTLLGMMGAEVIHIEMPGSGDLLIRGVSPGGSFPRGLSPGMMCANSNKYHIAVDVRHPQGKKIFRELVAISDVLVENFKAGTFDEWGIGYRQLSQINPCLIYASLQGFGNWGSLSDRPSYDAYAQGVTGLAEITGFPDAIPLKSQAWIGDFLSGTMAAYLILVALYYRQKSGKGQFIDLSQAEVLIRAMDWTWLYIYLTGKNRERTGNRDYAVVPSLVAKAKDGFVAISAFEKREYRALCKAMGNDELLKFEDYEERFKNADLIYQSIEEWAKDRSVDEILKLSKEYDFAASKVMNSKDIYEDLHYNSRKAVWKFMDPLWDDLTYPNPLSNLEKTPGKVKWSIRPVGFDNEHVLGRILGYSKSEIEELYNEGVIGKWDENYPATAPPADWDGKKSLFY
ncbi:L-carnitine dehydratase/bile acid-inducible protein F [Thermosulfidibacter takaii ABI70S6]|uniref:L-carnitine dehydratase/bile acid-inducible protein F n=1 Tax=Thermosulfidibacter takaii (strain DSM 17441 / JCM 13301 / NBRC 103674 / ABI70S6) TaxID=1298851 RepID=A0A0S3QTC3_THET7|nr:CoA transferase [Thermosulfidibacter takaii]BAT71579.1 L-carnitine dehydratase/bile acid-inducible protein F [Thermosulfidibacter takaii ABI70S6]